MSVPEFTFGIELEYIVPYIYTGEADPEQGESRPIDRVPRRPNGFQPSEADDILIDNVVYNRVHRTLTFVGLPAAPMAAQPEGAPPVLPTEWDTVKDESLMETEEITEKYDNRYVPLEVRSPVLFADRPGFRSIRLAVDSLMTRHRLFVGKSCGYHVHVGRGTQGFSLPVLKRTAAFLWVFDRQLGSLHPMERHTNGYAVSMREKANISRYASDLREGIRAIYATQTARELVHLIHWTDDLEKFHNDDVFVRNMAYNFINIVHAEGKKTIEFRQFTSTTDSLDIKMWAEICVGIVMACSLAQEGLWINFLHNAASMEENMPARALKIGPLLRRIGLGDQSIWAQHRSNSLGFGGSCWAQ
ncbi:hypothetical protein V496_07854 [Pseudogymnoascus sp. VKM F-4515 (FW-2607)]|nr:hypothetical protein V496_07854 [Pseudogymnoascus sp. VKM F-4515 (FW-2607)]